MDLLIGTYTEGTDALGIYGVVVSSEGSSQAIALDIPVRNPSFLAIHPSLPILYVVEELGKGEGGGLVSAFSWNGSGFSLLSRQSSLGEDPCHLSISPDGQLLAVANYSTGSVVVFILDDEGGIHGDPVVIEHQIEFQR
ncbi:MAG: beta-propeller fold lactonase family protein, partial [Gammaproteobacteria bacterium]